MNELSTQAPTRSLLKNLSQTWLTYRQQWLRCLPVLIAQGLVLFLLFNSNQFLGPMGVAGPFSLDELIRLSCLILVIYFTAILLEQIHFPKKSLADISHDTGKLLFHITFAALLMIITSILLPLLVWAILLSPDWQDFWLTMDFSFQGDAPWWHVIFSYLVLIITSLLCLWPAVSTTFTLPMFSGQPMNGTEAFKKSFQLTWGHWWLTFSAVWLTTLGLGVYLSLFVGKLGIILGFSDHYLHMGVFIVNQLLIMPWFLCAQIVSLQTLTNKNEI